MSRFFFVAESGTFVENSSMTPSSSAIAPSSGPAGWYLESIRFTAFMNTQSIEWTKVLSQIVGSSASRSSQDFAQQTQTIESDLPESRVARLVVAPDKADFLVQPKLQDSGLMRFPRIGLVNEEVDTLGARLDAFLEPDRPVQRLALGIVALRDAASKEEAYRKLAELLPGVRIDSENSHDFLYRINRPRVTKVGEKSVIVNRLGSWACAQLVSARIDVSLKRVFQEPLKFAVRTELDINSAPQSELSELKLNERKLIFRQFLNHATELLTRGDQP